MSRSVRLPLTALLAAFTALTATVAVSASAPQSHAMRMKGGGHQATSTNNLLDHGGAVLAASKTYAIWWGSTSAWSTDVQSGVGSFFGGLNGSSFLGIASQYMRGSSATTSWSGVNYSDPSNPPKSNPSTATIMNEVVKEVGQANLNSSAIYFVFTSNFPRGVNYCAWHSWGSSGGKEIQFAYMPNTTGVRGCDPGNLYNLSGSQGLRSLVNVTSHEYMEAITDPDGTTWYDSAGSEIGDKCAWTFSAPVTLKNGSIWQLQEEWSNSVSGCVQD